MNNNLAQTGLDQFITLCHQEQDPQRLQELFRLFLTPEEQEQLGMRTLLVQKLLAGAETQREMAENLGISIAKITRGSNNLKLLSDDLRNYLLKVFEC